ncbi:hypothetical protein D9615_005072 [Tricholomella constricta]|uniref:Uncharacterized protein n=1 Tax=Tricholomella constricta TaxID=117010 RepID=A0A8H5M6X4_9AGAR|nr:hypothetical protein D9615_005072 [Tricholomella constricta]
MVSCTITTLILAAATAMLALAAPTKPLDSATLLKNGQEAQRLNLAFQTMKEADPCTNDEKACMSGGIAACRNGTWAVPQGRCSKTQDCFALPSVREVGTDVMCTSERNALSAIEATGATGGIFGNSTATAGDECTDESDDENDEDSSIDSSCDDGEVNNGKDTECPADTGDECDDNTPISTSSSSSASTTPSPPSSSKPEPTANFPKTVTTTITLGDQPTTLPPVTRTISPEEASSILSSLMANGATIIEAPVTSTAILTSSEATTTTIPASVSAPVTASTSNESPSKLISLTLAPSSTDVTPAVAQSAGASID